MPDQKREKARGVTVAQRIKADWEAVIAAERKAAKSQNRAPDINRACRDWITQDTAATLDDLLGD